MSRRVVWLAPLALVLVVGVAFWAMLNGMAAGTFDPRGVSSPLVGKALPAFDLPAQAPGRGFSSADVEKAGHPVLINFFASWCVPCVAEAPELRTLAQAGVPIWGIAYKDKPEAAADFLRRNGDPYVQLAADAPGRTAIDFGVYGVPETYFVDRSGIVRWRWAGPLTPDVVRDQLQPLLRKYR